MESLNRILLLVVIIAFVSGLWIYSSNIDAQETSPAPIVDILTEVPAATGGLSVDADGNIYVADIGLAPARQGRTIYKVTPEGEVSIFAESTDFTGASGNAFDSEGNLYQSSFNRNRISKITPEGEVSLFATQGIFGPGAIVIDEEDSLYVVNCQSRTIQKITQSGESTTVSSSPLFACATGLAVDSEDNFYVVNFNNGNVAKVDAITGEVTTFATITNGGNGHITYSETEDILYVVALAAAQVYTVSLDGEVKLFAGTGSKGHDVGPVLEATFSRPNDLAISPNGNILYINDAIPTNGANQPSYIKRIILNPDQE